MIPEGISINVNHGDDKGVDCRGLDHCEAYKQCAGDGGRGVRLLRQGGHGGGHGTALSKRRPHATEACGDAGGGNGYYCNDGGGIHLNSSCCGSYYA